MFTVAEYLREVVEQWKYKDEEKRDSYLRASMEDDDEVEPDVLYYEDDKERSEHLVRRRPTCCPVCLSK